MPCAGRIALGAGFVKYIIPRTSVRLVPMMKRLRDPRGRFTTPWKEHVRVECDRILVEVQRLTTQAMTTTALAHATRRWEQKQQERYAARDRGWAALHKS